MLERLVYRSTASGEMDSRQLFDLLTQAQERKARLGITGHLLYLRGQFTQCVEGPTEERRFSEWSRPFPPTARCSYTA